MIGALNSARANEAGNGYTRVQVNKDLVKLREVLGIDWEQAFIKNEKLNLYAKGWGATFKFD